MRVLLAFFVASGAALLSVSVTAAALSVATNSPKPLSARVTSYDIDADLNTDKKSLDATEVLTYKNVTGQPLSSIPFHLYLDAFRPQSTFTSETHFTGGIRDSESEDDYPSEKLGGITVSKITADSYGDLSREMHFTAPDNGNAEDHTVAEIHLPHPLAAGDTITFHLAFHDQFPLSIARNGTSATSSWVASGTRSQACFGTARGIVTSTIQRRSSFRTSGLSLSI